MSLRPYPEPSRFESLLSAIEYLREEAIRISLTKTAVVLQRALDCMRPEFSALTSHRDAQKKPLLSEAAAAASESAVVLSMLKLLSEIHAGALACSYRPNAVRRYFDAEYRRALLHAATSPLSCTELDTLTNTAIVAANTYADQFQDREFLLWTQARPWTRADIDLHVPIGYGCD
ncbi:hypothetical protein GALL_230730 [mine drainage metagenome]|uniref:Uncharacterized protein n=1 Tax=mine drainage metagenome TaxID=410659 RepID=A0A1J5RHS0_9ZZZZ